MKKLILLPLLLFISLNSFALTESQIKKEFEKFYYSGEVSARHCGRNIDNFIQKLKSQGHSVSKIDTIYMTAPRHQWSFGKVMAINSRFGRNEDGNLLENWYFHVVAVYKGKVYDFSFNDEPLVLSVENYLNRMFVPSTPFMPYGSTFRIGGRGPYYTAEIAKEALSRYVFDILKNDGYGTTTTRAKGLSTKELLNRY